MEVVDGDKLKKLQEKPQLDFVMTADGKGIKTTSPRNVALILRLDDNFKGVFRWNKFTESIDVTKAIKIDLSQWGMPTINIAKGPLTDKVADDIALYCDVYPDYQVTFKPALISQALGSVARGQAYNPITDYFDDCKANWDGKSRLYDFFPTFLGADHSPTNDLIVKLIFEGVVAKAYDPDVKFDWVLDLVGGQGVGKTTLLQKIAPLDAYTDQILSFTDKDDFAAMRNALLVNDDEMTVSNRTSFEEIKKFITMKEFTYRPPYAHTTETFKKKFVLFRTTNEIRHLKDKSGDRRFLSVMCHKEQQKLHPVTDLSKEYVDQLWGEVATLYAQEDHPFQLTAEQNELLDESRQQFMYTSALEDSLRDVLSNEFNGLAFITNNDMWRTLETELSTTLSNKQKEKVRYYMEHLGWQVGAVRKIKTGNNYKSTRGFRKL